MNKLEYFEKDIADADINYSGSFNTPFTVKHILNLSEQKQHDDIAIT